MMTRSAFQKLSAIRFAEAATLLAAGRPDGAYYLAGYAVECALKACIAKRTRRFEFPDRPEVVKGYYTHNLESLLSVARLKELKDAHAAGDPLFYRSWLAVRDWNEQSRYTRWRKSDAASLIEAAGNEDRGVLPWIRIHW